MPSLTIRPLRRLGMAACVLAALVIVPNVAVAGTCSPAGVTVSTWAQFRTATTGITSCTAGNTYTVTIAADFAYSAPGGTTGLSWNNAGALEIVGAPGAQRVIDMTGADTYFVRHISSAPLTLRNLVVKNLDGTAQSSSPVYVPNGVVAPTITLDNTTVQDNNTSNPPVFGGGLTSMVSITNGSRVVNNVANGADNDVVVANRRQGQGGGVYSATSVTISNSTVSGNSASGSGSGGGGGAWAQGGDVTVTNSTIASNTTSEAASTGGGLFSAQYMTVTGSTVSGNTVTGNGGGVYANYNSVFTNTTIANNTATGSGGGAYTVGLAGPPRGGAVFNYSTIAGNTAATAPAINANSNLTLTGSVVDNGTAPAPCSAFAAWKASSYSVSTGSSCLQTSGTGDAVKNSGSEIKLGALAANGGTTNTMLPQAGSVLIGWINTTNPVPGATTDQRGTARSQPFTAGAVQVNSSDADLSALGANAGGALTLSPTFAAATTAYTAPDVANGVTSATITPTVVTGHGATVTVNGVTTTSGTASAPVNLSVGPNAIPVVVTAQDGTTTKTYTVTITRISADATLSGLVLTAGGTAVPLTPAFAAGTLTYTATVPNDASTATVTPTRNQANASITVDGTAVTSGTASGAIALAVGTTTIPVVVTAQDGTTTKAYSVTVTRAAAAVTPAPEPDPDATPSAISGEATGAMQIIAARAAPGTRGITVRLSARRSGRVSIRGTVASGTLMAAEVACRGDMTIARAGTYTVRCALTTGARQTLARRTLLVTVITTFTAPDGSTASVRSRVRIPRRASIPIPVIG